MLITRSRELGHVRDRVNNFCNIVMNIISLILWWISFLHNKPENIPEYLLRLTFLANFEGRDVLYKTEENFPMFVSPQPGPLLWREIQFKELRRASMDLRNVSRQQEGLESGWEGLRRGWVDLSRDRNGMKRGWVLGRPEGTPEKSPRSPRSPKLPQSPRTP